MVMPSPTKLLPIFVLPIVQWLQVPAATAPAKEAVYEEATKNTPLKDELHLKKLSDYKTLSKVPKYLASSRI